MLRKIKVKMASESQSSNTVESITNLRYLYLNKTLAKVEVDKLNNDILFLLETIDPEFVSMWKYSSSTLKLRTEFIREFMRPISKIETEGTEEIIGVSMSLDFRFGFNSLLSSLPNNVHCLLLKYRLVNEFYLVLLFLMANKHVMNYEVFEKICFKYGPNRRLFYIKNESNMEDIKGNVLEIDLLSVTDKLEWQMRENNERFGKQVTKYVFIGITILSASSLIVLKFMK